MESSRYVIIFFFQAEDGIRDVAVTGVQTCALPISAAGDVLVAVSDERKARQVATMRQDRDKLKGKTATRITLEGLQKQIQSGEVKELRLILKADVQGSVEALAEALERLSTEEVKLKVIH